MQAIRLARASGALVLALAFWSGNALAAPCDRACLKSTLDQYLKAVAKHDRGAAPLGVAFRETENAAVTPAGAGLWNSMTAIGKLDRRYVDTATGEAAFFGTIEEAAGPAIVTLRLKV